MSGGGSQGAGTVGYAAYLETAHETIMGDFSAMQSSNELVSVMEATMAANPYGLHDAFSPDAALIALTSEISAYQDAVDDLADPTYIQAAIDSHDVDLTYRLENDTLPKYNALMRDINFVQSSSFAIGSANLYAAKDRAVADFEGKLKLEAEIRFVQGMQFITEFYIKYSAMDISSHTEEEQRNAEVDELHSNWELDALLKGGQFLGALGGGTIVPVKANKTQSAVSGALAGAAAGAYIGSVVPGIGTGIGAGIGAIAGAGAAFL